MATLRGDEDVRSSSIVGAPALCQPLSWRQAAPLTSLAAALVLTSKQRFLGENILRSIALLLRRTTERAEAAALLTVMEDPVASEYIMTSAGRPDEHTVATAGTSMPAALFFADDAERLTLSSTSSSVNGVDLVPGARMQSSVYSTCAQSADSPLRRPGTGSEGLVHVPSMSASSSPPFGALLQHSNSSPNLPGVFAQSRPPGSETPAEHAIRAASAAASSPLYTYGFPEKWLSNVVDTAAPHAAQNTPRRMLGSTGMRTASVTIKKGFRHPSQMPAKVSSPTFTTRSSPAAISRSPSLGTAVFSPMVPPASGPVLTAPRSSPTQASVNTPLAVATAQPPLFFDNQLFDPTTNRCLFGGHAFREEVRVLPAPAVDASRLTTSRVGEVKRGDCVTGHSHGSPSPTLLLVREYIPVSAECGLTEGELGALCARGVGADAVFVQCFSLLPPHQTYIGPHEYRLLPEATITACLLAALPGCVTLATPLDAFLCDMRHSFLTVAESSLERLLIKSQEAAKRACERRSTGGPSHITSETPSTSPNSVRISHASSSLEAAEKERDAARMAVVWERLSQRVLPEMLDEALDAIRSTLVAYCIRYEQRRLMRAVLDAVRMLQRFFRRCLAVKERAVRRMVRLWRRLEVDAQLKLQQHPPRPSAVKRMDAVANSILQDHMLTSQSYKRSFIQDQWAQRRRAFDMWREQEEWNSVFASAMLPKGNGSESGVDAKAAEKRPCSSRLTAAEQLRLESDFNKRRSSSKTTTLLRLVSHSSSKATETYADREQAAIRRFLSWYIDPQELLYLSHQCLLETLKGSVFRMVEVQIELKRAANELTNGES